MPSPSAPSLREDGSFAVNRRCRSTPRSSSTWRRPVRRINRRRTAASTAPARGCRCWCCRPSRGGWVNSQVFDHTSVLQFTEKRFQVHEPNISARRRAVCGDLTSAFNFVDPNGEALPNLPATSRHAADGLRQRREQLPQVPLPSPVHQRLPHQRRRRALPARCPTSCTSRPPSRPNSAA